MRRVTEELTELAYQGEQDQEQVEGAVAAGRGAAAALESLQTRTGGTERGREQAQTDLRACRVRADAARQDRAQQAAALESLRVRVAATEQALARLERSMATVAGALGTQWPLWNARRIRERRW
jgi:chromosome segregation ATPase